MKYQKKNRKHVGCEFKRPQRKSDALPSCKTNPTEPEYPLEKEGWQMERILNTLVEHVVYHDTDRKVLWANRAACQSVGLDLDQVIGRRCYEIWAQRTLPCDDCPVSQALKSGKPHSVEKKTPDGRYWYINAAPVVDANGRIVSMVELTLDISERKKAEEALRQAKDNLDQLVQERTAKLAESEAKYRALVENTKDIAFSIDVSGILQYIGPQSIQYGFEPNFLEGRHISDLAFPDDRDIVVSEFNKSISSGETSPAELRILTPDGRLIWLEQSSSVQRDAYGRIVGITGVLRDITARKKAERQRSKYRKRLQRLTARLAMAQDEEQRRIAEGLHDDVGQDLALCNLKLALADREKDLLKANSIRNEVSELKRCASSPPVKPTSRLQ